MVEIFLDPGDRAPGTVWQRRHVVKQFALFLQGRGMGCWTPPERFDATPTPRFNPRIITAPEMARLIAIADAMPPSPSAPSGAAIYGMLLRMLWCCGLRISEALALRVGDVDLDREVISVRHAKGNKTRLVPMSLTLTTHARAYLPRVGLGGDDPQTFFYPSRRGGHYKSGSVLHRVQQFMLAADVTVDGVKPARVHDIRHSYAVAALSKMQADGMDSYTCLPLLATFMGHRDVTSTEYYLRLTGSRAAQLAAENGAAHLGLYPEVD
jgi:integrase/recombinase XerD